MSDELYAMSTVGFNALSLIVLVIWAERSMKT